MGCYPKMWHLGIMSILNWRSSRKSRCKKLLWVPFFSSPLEHVIKLSCETCSPCNWREGTFLSWKTKKHRVFPSLLHLILYSLTNHNPPNYLPSTIISPSNLAYYCSGLHLPMKAPCHIKSTLNKLVCLFPINLFLTV